MENGNGKGSFRRVYISSTSESVNVDLKINKLFT